MHTSAKTALAGEVEGGSVRLSCRRGAADDLTFYSRRETESDFTALDNEGEQVVDDRPKLDPGRPEVRRYFALLLYGGDETRLKTNEVVLTLP